MEMVVDGGREEIDREQNMKPQYPERQTCPSCIYLLSGNDVRHWRGIEDLYYCPEHFMDSDLGMFIDTEGLVRITSTSSYLYRISDLQEQMEQYGTVLIISPYLTAIHEAAKKGYVCKCLADACLESG